MARRSSGGFRRSSSKSTRNTTTARAPPKTNTQPSLKDSDSGEVIDTYYLEEEKHFDCTVQEINKEDRTKEGVICNYSVVTECGIFFYTNKKYKIGLKTIAEQLIPRKI